MFRQSAALFLVLLVSACGGGGGGGSGSSAPAAASVNATPEFTRGYAQFSGTPSATAAGDLDGDGRDDVVVVTSGSEQLYVFYQRPTGPESTSAPTASAGAADKSVGTAVCDVDGDGRNEILVGYALGDLSIYKPGTDGRPALWRTLAGIRSASVLCADIDGDGLADVITTGKPGVTMQVLLQRAGALQEQGSYPSDSVALGIHDLGDIDGDGTADVVFFGRNAQGRTNLYAYLQTAPGQFAPPVTLDFPRDASGDIAAKGLAVTPLAPGKRNVIASVGDASYAQTVVTTQGAVPVALQTMAAPGYVRVRDLNGDARPDIVVFHDGAVGVYLQNPDGSFAAEQTLYTYPADPAVGAPVIAFGDFDGDGKLDIAVASQTALSLFFQD